MYYIFIKDDKLTGCGQCKQLNEDVINTEVPKELYDDYLLTPDKYIVGEKEIEIEIPEFETVTEEYEDENGETQSREVQVPIMIEVDETTIQKTHTETITVPYPVVDPDYEKKQAQKREDNFNAQFFNTSLGYIRRAVTMANGTHKDFLSDLLPAIAASVQAQQTVNLIAYEQPPFDEDITDWKPYQHIVQATPLFVQECFLQLGNDFLPINEE